MISYINQVLKNKYRNFPYDFDKLDIEEIYLIADIIKIYLVAFCERLKILSKNGIFLSIKSIIR